MPIKKRGIDIAEKRLDSLARSFFSFLLKQNARRVVLDLGCGSGWVGIAAAYLHHKSYLYDITDSFNLIKKIDFLNKEFSTKIFFSKKDLSDVDYDVFPKKIDVVYMGSFLHYLKYFEAKKILKIIKKNLNVNGRIFVSVSGVDTELAKGYKKETKIEKRFFPLSHENQKRFLIKKPVVLYNKKELIKLFEDSGFKDIDVQKTAFGNIKGIFVLNK